MSEFVRLPSGRIINLALVTQIGPLYPAQTYAAHIWVSFPGGGETTNDTRLEGDDALAFAAYMDTRAVTLPTPEPQTIPDPHYAALATACRVAVAALDAYTKRMTEPESVTPLLTTLRETLAAGLADDEGEAQS